jgi:ABC-type nitrate/sulfonate/bicarbonate transport system ATPase subunit
VTGQSTYFETTHSQHVVKELKLAINDGKLIVLAAIVGTGKTTTLRKIQNLLEQDKEKEILVCEVAVDGGRPDRSRHADSRALLRSDDGEGRPDADADRANARCVR